MLSFFGRVRTFIESYHASGSVICFGTGDTGSLLTKRVGSLGLLLVRFRM